jgi:uncharacterized protein
MNNLLDPAILFFVFGLVAGALRSNLEIPAQFSKFLSLYLLMALGLKGGFALSKTGFTHEVVISLALALLLAVSVPLLGYAVLRRFLNGYDAAALAATYGSVSAVTFITAVQVLDTRGIDYGGHMAAAMALMESPAIVLAVMLANRTRQQERTLRSTGVPPAAAAPGMGNATAAGATPTLGHLLREALTDGAQLLLLGSMLIGWMTGDSGSAAMQPFAGDLFKGMLAFFLLDMGLLAARNAGGLKGVSMWLPAYAVVAPLVHAGLALGLARLADLSLGNAVLLMVLAASASYIAVPAVVSRAIPEARPSLYFGMSLGLTFPLNILLGIPLYTAVAQRAFST